MSLNLNQSNVSLDNPVFAPMLRNLQANILKFHGRDFAYHSFFRIRAADVAAAKTWISRFAATKVTSAEKQLRDARAFKEASATGGSFDGGTLYSISISARGYDVLGMGNKKPDDAAFRGDLQSRSGILNDRPERWTNHLREEIHFMVITADDDAGKAEKAEFAMRQEAMAFADFLYSQRGNILRMAETGIGIEHFAYADGISQPMYLADEIAAQNAEPGPLLWDDTTNLDLLLVAEKDGAEPDCFGSYMVFRKLEQNVKSFKDAEGDNRDTPGSHVELPEVKDVSGADNEELPGAMIVGRFESGSPVTKDSTDSMAPGSAHELDNNFDYANDKGLKCPYHAHIRLVNPRKGDTDLPDAEIRKHRITRRGIPFDDHGIKRFPDDKATSIDEDMLGVDNQPAGNVGLLFMCYQSNIENQFEVLQGRWVNTGVIKPGSASKGEDSVIGQGANASRTIPDWWGQAGENNAFQFDHYVTMRGGEYFFTPSISFLKQLG